MLLAASVDQSSLLLFFHSVLRWALVLAVAVAGFAALAGWVRKGPVITWQRTVAIWAVVIAHAQLVLGLALYATRMKGIERMARDQAIYWKYEHAGLMLIAVALVTIGRLASRKARGEQAKHLRVAVFYLAALALMLWMMPWPFTALGSGLGWL
ncbi:MAG TPA: hypothetical protein PKD45_14295 [Flavobacteriales bacterium]|nr:hypothetical protein [Flavobacteriales bacterium]